MPRKSPISQADLAIARRLRKLRVESRLSREDWARRSHVPADVITRIELGKMPLRYEIARALLLAWNEGLWGPFVPVNPMWLAEGLWPIQLNWPLLLPATEQIGLPITITFSEFVATHRDLLLKLMGDAPEAELPDSWLQPYFSHWLALRSKSSRLTSSTGTLECVFRFSALALAERSSQARRLLKQYGEFQEALSPSERSIGTENIFSQFAVDTGAAVDITVGEHSKMKQLDQLIIDLKRHTAAPGAKAALARRYGVSRQAVNRWLKKQSAPSAEIALDLRVLIPEENKTKGPESVSPLPEPKTPKGHINETPTGPTKESSKTRHKSSHK